MKPVFLQNKKGDNFFQVTPFFDISWNNNQIPCLPAGRQAPIIK
jgi:hypothetical protein